MRIHSIELKNFRGIKHLNVEEIPDTGVTVIHGRNEAGKTTILQAIDTLIKHKFKSKRAEVRALQPVNADVSPEVAMEFSVGPYRLKLAKRWLRQSSALLEVLSPGHDTYTGEEAESKLDEILDRYLDRNLFAAMFLDQDDLHEGIKAAGISSVAGVLSNQTGEESAQGDDAEATTELMKQVDSDYERYFSLRTGAEAKELKTARQDYTETANELADSRQALAALADYVERFEQAQEQQRDAEAKLPEAKDEVTEYEQQLKNIDGLQAAVDAREKDEKVAQTDLELAQSQLKERRKLREELQTANKNAEDINAAVASAKEKDDAEKEEIKKLNDAVDAARTRVDEARKRAKNSRSQLEQLQDQVKAQELRTKSASVEDYAKQLTEIRTTLEKFGPAISDSDVQRVEKREQDLELNRRLRDAAVAKLVFSADNPQSITVNGQDVEVTSADSSVELTAGLTLKIGDVTARYEPGTGANSAQDLDREIEKLTELYETELEKLGCKNTNEVREKRDTYKELVAQRQQLEIQLDRILDGEDLEQLRVRVAALGESPEVTTENASDEDAIDKARADISAAEEAEESANNDLSNAQAKLKPWEERPAHTALIRIESEAEQALKLKERLAADIENANEKISDAELEGQFQKAEAKVQECKKAVQKAREELDAANPELAQSLAAGAQAQLVNLQKQLRDSENQQNTLTGHIQMQTGVAERVEKAEAAEELARNILESIEHRAAAVRHLREVLLRHQREARERYAAPFAQQLGQLAGRVFNGNVQFHLNDDLVVEKRTLDGVTVGLEDLSGGAKEQMAILTRFAIAQLLSQGGEQGAPVMVDDALGSTDAQRIRLMATLFAEVGKDSQVIVFTCEPSRYDRVPDSTLLDIDQLKASAPIG
ncbi:AAA family ATPase [Corynebacterium ammoniagenes]|uniref:DNA repair ATPase n=2 Tax=Corynebacterium ammoniagenes TaxID=1697 RepID=A0AAV5G7U6_CORAM|nr:AAA family ATPase [Corynebacterium ammoniagenes]APT82925.1 ATPase [Corynebacterium ammoniagenes DSM 20306]AQS73972.1 ATPase [Corynebacterium ammoniagenes]EFG80640.1 RecF/RecN/SMC N-terminal domain protein [Corynebacterium ammoniagenes DSM 20306]GJN42817.1 DNA repair ATPase [Corynebacterium ammoniagenes]